MIGMAEQREGELQCWRQRDWCTESRETRATTLRELGDLGISLGRVNSGAVERCTCGWVGAPAEATFLLGRQGKQRAQPGERRRSDPVLLHRVSVCVEWQRDGDVREEVEHPILWCLCRMFGDSRCCWCCFDFFSLFLWWIFGCSKSLCTESATHQCEHTECTELRWGRDKQKFVATGWRVLGRIEVVEGGSWCWRWKLWVRSCRCCVG